MREDLVRRPDTVLLVHADAASRGVVADLLRAARFTVEGVSSAGEALAMLAGSPAPCIILYGMTGPDDGSVGFRSAQLADPAFAAVPIVMWTVPNTAAGSHDKKFLEALLALVGRHCAETEYAS